ncbi:MAG: HNH endonuclease [Fluviicoccus sp.]|uniref:HNH endonuclease n=1 Tax=Fluviicoccus sp. TaxID=2003552 RepID=UPI0027221A3A|nr:HNH endonuclease [Fluviicoccus sp.]MDO8329577.1 HNH endonuclease [Fluviicoccus sp.]
MSLESYIRKMQQLVVNQAYGRASPHKICMVLAVFDLARSGGLTCNRIFFSPDLKARYKRYFDAVRSPQDHANPHFPFFHLQGQLRQHTPSFWHLVPYEGREAVVAAMSTATAARAIEDNIAWAALDEELFALLQDPASREVLAESLASHWFDRGLQDLYAVVEQGKQISRYEQAIRGLTLDAPAVREMPAAVRDPAFRRVVTEKYDYRCAATGLRLLLSDGTAMVEAAHIHPFSESADDDPRNGLALTPDMHWAMDKYLIAPGPDFKWHVSSLLDDRIPDNRLLTDLKGKALFLPAEMRFYPKQEVLDWRLEVMRRNQ